MVATPERRAVDPEAVAKHLAADAKGAIKAVMFVQNETATGMRHPVAEMRAAMNRLGHPALYHGRHDLVARLVRLPHG